MANAAAGQGDIIAIAVNLVTGEVITGDPAIGHFMGRQQRATGDEVGDGGSEGATGQGRAPINLAVYQHQIGIGIANSQGTIETACITSGIGGQQ